MRPVPPTFSRALRGLLRRGVPPLTLVLAALSLTAAPAAATATGGSTSSPPATGPTAPATPPATGAASLKPSIAGTPAPRNWVSCEAGLAAGTQATLTYQWLRDLVPIRGATAQRYYVKPRDGGHHLQCRVTATTATGSETAISGFANVPMEEVPAAAGETTVAQIDSHGNWVNARIECSPHAVQRCKIELQLTVFEQLREGRVAAVYSRPRPGQRDRVAVLGESQAQIPRGHHQMLHVQLDAAGRALLHSRPHGILPVKLTVTGTVIGVLSATLAEEAITVALPGRSTAPAGRRGQSKKKPTPSQKPAGSHQPTPTGSSSSAHGGHGQAHDSARRRARTAAHISSRRRGRSPTSSRRTRRPRRARSTRNAPAQTFTEETSPTLLAATPYMGWDTYFAFGGVYDESSVLTQASEMLQLGLVHLGYRYVWLDSGWWQGQRAANGEITVDHAQWPHGIRWLAETLHAAGMKLGIYTDAGREGCGGAEEGSFGHYRQDVNTFASWGVDAIKVDFCGGSEQHLHPKVAYTAFHDAILHNRLHRPMLLSVCNFLQPGTLAGGRPPYGESAFTSYQFAPPIANSWRTDTDVGRPGHVTFAHVLRNLDADAAHPEAAGPGHWNNPDYLGPGQGLTAAQFRTQLSMWAILAAPLMISAHLEDLSPADLATLRNPEAIAIDQDPAGVQGTLVESTGEGQVWVKPLLDGSRAVALLNRGSTPLTISTTAAAIGMPKASLYSLRDLWAHSESSTAEAISTEVPAYSTVLLRVSAES